MRLTERAIGLLAIAVASISVSAGAKTPEAVPGEFIVKMRTPVTANKNAVSALSSRLGAYIKRTMPEQNLVVIKRPVFETTNSVVKTLAQDPAIEYIEPNFIYRISKTPNDPMLGQLWGMNNTKNPGIDIGALKAWELETGSKDVVVAVIDTGINYNHPDLAGNVWVNEAEKAGKVGIDDDGNGVVDDIYGYNAITQTGDPLDDHGHGSHTSGTIGASGDDGKGIVGVNWNVRIMGSKFLSAEGSGTLEGAILAIDYATKMGANIMSNSWGGGGFSQALSDAIQRAADKGILFVAAAGNESNNNDAEATYPAGYNLPNVLAVAAVDDAGHMASFSNYGRRTVQVGAPGVNITSSINTGGYDTWSGTSMATPHVSGIAALLLAHEPGMTAVQMKDRIVQTANPIPGLHGKVSSGGMANAFFALTSQVPPADPNDPANWQSVSVSAATAHPYDINAKQTYQVSVPGAKQISIYFERFVTENNYDFVTIKDAAGNVVDKMTGNQDDSFSRVIDGDSATLEFTSDSSINNFGFEVTKAAWR